MKLAGREGSAGAGGSELLRALAGVARRSLRHDDRVFSDGEEDELVLILAGTDGQGAKAVGGRLARNMMETLASAPGEGGSWTLEMGWSTFPEEGVTAQEMVALARRRCVPAAPAPEVSTAGGE